MTAWELILNEKEIDSVTAYILSIKDLNLQNSSHLSLTSNEKEKIIENIQKGPTILNSTDSLKSKYSFDLGIFKTEESALKEANQYEKYKDQNTYIIQMKKGKKISYKLYFGSFTTQKEANAFKKINKIKKMSILVK